jgi:hypothetical protein
VVSRDESGVGSDVCPLTDHDFCRRILKIAAHALKVIEVVNIKD